MSGRATTRLKLSKCRLPIPPGKVSFLSIVLIFFLVEVPRVNAHSIHVLAWVEGDKVVTESYFSRENKVIEGQIKVYGPSGKKLLEGRTDAHGFFSFKIPKKSDLRIVLESAMGHRAETILKWDEIREKSLIRSQKESGPSVLKIILGLGVIFGLMVLTLYLRKRKRGSTVVSKGRNEFN